MVEYGAIIGLFDENGLHQTRIEETVEDGLLKVMDKCGIGKVR